MASDPTDIAPVADPEPIRFRAGKKRKLLRKRNDEDSDEVSDASPQKPAAQPRAAAADYFDDKDQDDESAAAVVKARNARGPLHARLRGVAFRAGPNQASTALVPSTRHHDGEGDVPVVGIADRFTKQTGLITDRDDRHMNEYIESRLRRREAEAQRNNNNHASQTGGSDMTGNSQAGGGGGSSGTGAAASGSQPMLQGKLMEVDLPAGDRTAAPSAASLSPNQKRRSEGTQGARKPWQSRRRRGSDDIKRDALVEQFLHENRLDVYDVPDARGGAPGNEAEVAADGDADERLADEFRRQFEEEVAQRRQRKRAAAAQRAASSRKPKQAKPTEILHGPKLGGSRNSRAAVRDALLQQEREKKKTRR